MMKIQLVIAKFFALLALIFIPVGTSAAMVDIEAQYCTKITNDQERLACFDLLFSAKNSDKINNEIESQVAGSVITTADADTLITEPVVPIPVVKNEPDVNQQLEQNFGVEHKKTQAEIDADHFIFTIKTARKNPHGKWSLTFTNGQKWTTITSGNLKLKVDQKVKVSRGMFNSFSLTTENSNRSIKVKRIK